MCGIMGFIGFHLKKDINEVIDGMLDALVHRGPDANGRWVLEEHQLCLGHTRLSILDLSEAGSQPMTSHCQRYVMVFNGEIYNHLQMRVQLAQDNRLFSWKGHSDTETLLNAVSLWGVEKTLSMVRGMFVFALWDKLEKKLILARDRMGEKPLYYGWIKGNFVFASELKALCKFPQFSPKISSEALEAFMNYSAIPTPLSIYENIFKLQPGCILEMNLLQEKKIYPYWRFEEMVRTEVSSQYQNESLAIKDLKNTLMEAVEMQMISDVPIGAFLSGGVDSSLVVALMQQLSVGKVKTFTIGFSEKKYNESIYAETAAKHLGTDHHCVHMSSKNLMDVIPLLAKIYDEPFADSSQIPTYLVSKVAKEHVKVAISGDAGDELFGGYERYIMAPQIWKKLSILPFVFRKNLGHLCYHQSKNITRIYSLINKDTHVELMNQRISKFSGNLSHVKSIDEFYHAFLVNGEIKSTNISKIFFSQFNSDILNQLSAQERMMVYDSLHYLPNDILTKVDRAAMSVNLETRIPMLDLSVLEMAWRIPRDMKFRNGQGKWILKQILSDYLPHELIHRPKMGFGIPLGDWLKTSLRDWVELLISKDALAHECLDMMNIQKMWEEHLSGKRSHASYLWNICMFQAWYQEYM